ncbi:hypothetical protein AAHE18_02G146500 [Arachis hypogaea]
MNHRDAGKSHMKILTLLALPILQINLSYSSVTDVGLLSLASISSLQSFVLLHQQGLAPGGLVAALLTCGGLTKVKLHSSTRFMLPEQLIKHIEARG